MISVCVQGRTASATTDDAITSGSRGINVHFSFSPDWEGFTKTACFFNGGSQTDVPLSSDECILPDVVSGNLSVGVYGEYNGIVMASTRAHVGIVRDGAHV